jgi:GrpB-like predicted nucleotidyltransferase (UPF0157 family)
VTYRIELVESDPGWKDAFRREAQRLEKALGPRIVRIHHVGSTAVPGIRAKPIVDIAIESGVYPPDSKVIETLQEFGYVSRGESNVRGRHWFTLGDPRTHHVHWCPLDGDVPRRQCRFVERLRIDAALSREYEALKVTLASRFPYDHDAYALGKSEFIQKVVGDSGEGEA